jgi:hypothetical protein
MIVGSSSVPKLAYLHEPRSGRALSFSYARIQIAGYRPAPTNSENGDSLFDAKKFRLLNHAIRERYRPNRRERRFRADRGESNGSA